MQRLDYATLRPGMLIGTTNLIHPISLIVRGTTAGLKNAFNSKIASHVLVVCETHDVLYGMEMAWPKIRRVDLKDYTKWPERIVFIAEHLDVNPARANEFLWESYSLRIRYGLFELLEFWGLPTDQPDKMICSELYREMLKDQGISFPSKWDEKVSPYDEQKWNGHKVKIL